MYINTRLMCWFLWTWGMPQQLLSDPYVPGSGKMGHMGYGHPAHSRHQRMSENPSNGLMTIPNFPLWYLYGQFTPELASSINGGFTWRKKPLFFLWLESNKSWGYTEDIWGYKTNNVLPEFLGLVGTLEITVGTLWRIYGMIATGG